jgi:UDP-2,3-diacylglucosamine pyrophosphatase LpxH
MPAVRTLFLSDIHLGSRACQADQLLEFLREHPAEKTCLVGDIIDFWAMSRGICWTGAQNTVVQKLLRRARHGERIILIPGNHDEALREYDGTDFGGIELSLEHIHVTADGRRLLVIHGDEFDQVTRYHRWVAVLGDIAYNLMVRANILLSWLRRRLGRSGYWSLAGYAKRKVKTAINFVFDFEDSVMRAARERGLDGVVCGHIHWAAIREVNGLTYINCGDWVDSCTAIVEHFDGQLELVQWGNKPATVTVPEFERAPEPASVFAMSFLSSLASSRRSQPSVARAGMNVTDAISSPVMAMRQIDCPSDISP